MAAPHVAGAAALYLETHPSASPAEVTATLLGAATPNVVAGVPAGSPNLLLFVGESATAPAPPAGGDSCVPSKPRSKNCK
jgi:subtilisin family serine protease